MNTLSEKALKIMRILISKVNEDPSKSYHTISNNAKHKLALGEFSPSNIHPSAKEFFKFYQITDGDLILIDIAMSKENNDFMLPYAYFDYEKEKIERLVSFENNEVISMSIFDEHAQKIFCYWVNIWFNELNKIFQIYGE